MKPFLRQHFEDAPVRRAELHELLNNLQICTDETEEMRLSGRIGEHYRMLGEYNAALIYLQNAVELVRKLGDSRQEIANLLRLATTLQYADRHAEALPLFRDALVKSRGGSYEDFALQHMGKCLVELGQIEEARTCFEAALVIRQIKGDTELLASTHEALDALPKMV
jgi:HTH-type transcriptional regulator, pleiotropic regulator of extracellular virulence genes